MTFVYFVVFCCSWRYYRLPYTHNESWASTFAYHILNIKSVDRWTVMRSVCWFVCFIQLSVSILFIRYNDKVVKDFERVCSSGDSRHIVMWCVFSKMNNHISCILIVTSVLFVTISSQLELNDGCQVARSGAEGICRFYEECSVVLNELLGQGLIPAKCGFQDRREIICCPLPPKAKPTTAPPTTTNRTSAKSKRFHWMT